MADKLEEILAKHGILPPAEPLEAAAYERLSAKHSSKEDV